MFFLVSQTGVCSCEQLLGSSYFPRKTEACVQRTELVWFSCRDHDQCGQPPLGIATGPTGPCLPLRTRISFQNGVETHEDTDQTGLAVDIYRDILASARCSNRSKFLSDMISDMQETKKLDLTKIHH